MDEEDGSKQDSTAVVISIPPTPPTPQGMKVTRGEMLVWSDHWWRVVDFVNLQHQDAEGKTVHEQQGVVIIPTGPTAGAEKRYLATQKREKRIGNVIPFADAAAKRKAHNDRVLAKAALEEDEDA